VRRFAADVVGVTATHRGRARFAKPAKGFLLAHAVQGLEKALCFA
jgi:hypothetical protein